VEVEAFAAELGLEVWFSPYPLELTPGEILSSFSDCAEREQRLWKRGGLTPERRVCGSLLPSRVSCRQWGKRRPGRRRGSGEVRRRVHGQVDQDPLVGAPDDHAAESAAVMYPL
jgi:hypothetical protein